MSWSTILGYHKINPSKEYKIFREYHYKERPRCRLIIRKILAEKPYISLQDIAKSYRYSDGLRKQARKMIIEGMVYD